MFYHFFFIFVGTINSFLRKLLFTPPGDIHQNAKFEYNLSIISTMFYDVCVSVDNMKIINNFTRNYFTALWCTPSSVQRYHALNVGRIMADKKVLKLRWYNNNQLNLKLFFYSWMKDAIINEEILLWAFWMCGIGHHLQLRAAITLP